MIIYKISILFLLLLSLFQPADKNLSLLENNNKKNSHQSSQSDSIYYAALQGNWNPELLKSYQRIILNSKIDVGEEKQKLEKLTSGFEKTFVSAIISRREANYELMFDSLYSMISLHTRYLPYYEELIFSASATNRLPMLEAKLNSDKSFDASFEKNILLYFINSAKSNYQEANKFISELILEDSTNPDLFYYYSYLQRNLGDYQLAINAIDKAINLSGNDEWFKVKAKLAKGSLNFLSGDYESALILYEEALKLSKTTNDRQDEAKALVNIGIIIDMRGEVDKARDKFVQSLNISRVINDKDNQAFAYSELGVSYSFTNELIEAKNNYKKSYDLYKLLGNKNRLSYLSNNLGTIYLNIFDLKSALKYYKEGIELAGDNKLALAQNLTGIADVYSNLSNYSEALKYYRKAKEISAEIKELDLSSQINMGLGILNFNLNGYSGSKTFFEEAFSESEESGNVFASADLYNKLGIVSFKLDSLEKAKYYLQESITFSKKIKSYYTETLSSLDLSLVYLESNDNTKARQYLAFAKNSASKYGFPNILSEAMLIEGNIYSKENKFTEAKNSYLAALDGARKLNESNLQIEALNSLAHLYASHSLGDAAESYFESAVKLIEDVSRPLFEENEVQIFYFSSKVEVYNSYVDFLLDKDRYKEAFELIDRSRSRNMMQNLNNIKFEAAVGSDSVLEKIYEYEWLLHSQLLSGKELDSVKIEYKILKDKIVSTDPSLLKYFNFSTPNKVENIQRRLSDNENFISIYSNTGSTHLFLISKKDFQHFEIGKGRNDILSMLSAISPFYDDSNSDHDFYNQDLFSFNSRSAFKFYSEILKPAVTKIKKGRTVIFSPSTELIAFPFEFLVKSFDERTSPYSYNDKEFLLYDYNISYSNSAVNYLELKESKSVSSDKSLIVGNPFINNNSDQFADRRGLLEENSGVPRNIALLPLKYSEEEINGVGSLVGPTQMLVNTDATETNFKLNCENNKIIHLSTHSMLFNKQPVIFFSNSYDTENDGFLEASEIVQLKLNSELVVLSSCNSGLGAIDASEGILGMSKAFFESGTKSVMVSLWEVNDKYTSKFMILFYKRLSEGFDKSEALRLAKIDFIKEYSANPFYWSAFVLNGNISKIELKQSANLFPYLIGLLLVIAITVSFIYFKRRHKLGLT